MEKYRPLFLVIERGGFELYHKENQFSLYGLKYQIVAMYAKGISKRGSKEYRGENITYLALKCSQQHFTFGKRMAKPPVRIPSSI